jgi:hypothetical protein
MIPSGTKINCAAWIRHLRPGVVDYKISVDKQTCLKYTASGTQTDYSNPETLDESSVISHPTITVSGETHFVELDYNTQSGSGPVFDMDEIFVTAVAGPKGESICV